MMSVSFCKPFEPVYMCAPCMDIAIMMSFCSSLCYTHSAHSHTYLLFYKDTFSFLFLLSPLSSSCQPSKCSLSLSRSLSVLLGLPVNDDSLLLQCFDEILWCRCHCCSHTLLRARICVCLCSFLSVMSLRLPDIGSMCSIKCSFNCKGCNIDGFDQYLCLL